MGGRTQRTVATLAPDDEPGGGHGAGDDPEDAGVRGCGAFAVDHHLLGDPIDDVALLPGEVVVVLDVQEHLGTEVTGDMAVDEFVVGRRVTPHELHGRPVFLAFHRIEVEPGEPLVVLGQLRVHGHGELAVVVADGRAGASASAVGQQGQVFARGQGQRRRIRRGSTVGPRLGQDPEGAELDEVVPAPAGPKLGPGAVTVPPGRRADVPIGVHDPVFAAVLEGRPDTEAGLAFDGADQFLVPFGQRRGGPIEDREFHAAGDVHADGVGDHGTAGREDAADRQSVADMGVGHQGPGDRDGQFAGAGHLGQGLCLQILAPLTPGRSAGDERLGHGQKGTREPAPEFVAGVRRGIPQHRLDGFGDPLLVVPGEAVPGDEGQGGADRISRRHAHLDEVFFVHGIWIRSGSDLHPPDGGGDRFRGHGDREELPEDHGLSAGVVAGCGGGEAASAGDGQRQQQLVGEVLFDRGSAGDEGLCGRDGVARDLLGPDARGSEAREHVGEPVAGRADMHRVPGSEGLGMFLDGAAIGFEGQSSP